ncbi:MAG TPA: HAD family hydrolase [Vicinamibacterales bacterium]|nr:HAD family hydrolase [Vicinamibacterales bacterium]
MSARPAVFLDRDGTLIHDVGYLSRVEDVQWFPYSIEAVRLLSRAGFLVCITTNQGGIGLGFYGPDLVERVHAGMRADVEAAGGRLDALFYCPHHPQAVTDALRLDCECRKPKAGMIQQARTRFDIDMTRSFVVGDKMADVGLATNAGARGILVKTGYGHAQLQRHGAQPPGAAYVAETVFEAAGWILSESGFPKEMA